MSDDGWGVDVDCEAARLLAPFPSLPGARRLIAFWMGARVEVVSGLVGCDARYREDDEGPVIEIRPKLHPKDERTLLLHELAEWWLGKLKIISPFIEQIANALAAALAAPSPTVRRLARSTRDAATAAEQIAFSCSTSKLSAFLRYGEETDKPMVVFANGDVHVRGPEWLWGRGRGPAQLRGLAKTPPPEGVGRVELGEAVGWYVADDTTQEPPPSR